MVKPTHNFSHFFKNEGQHIQASPMSLDDVNLNMGIARGNGCNYSDAGLADMMIHLTEKKIDIDKESRKVIVSSGVTYNELLEELLSQGLFIKVIPGFGNITIGGAIAANIHGKNHPVVGNISSIVRGIHLWTPSEGAFWCNERENKDVMSFTCGGFGLTGVILEAELEVVGLPSTSVVKTVRKGSELEDLVHDLMQSTTEYNVAWIDFTHKTAYPFILEMADHSMKKESEVKSKANLLDRLTSHLPTPRLQLIKKWSISLYNQLHFKSNSEGSFLTPISEFLFPLNKIQGWERLYGRKGFIQYQFVVNHNLFIELTKKVKRLLSAHNTFTSLAVVKKMGQDDTGSSLSFNGPGITLSLDIPASKTIGELHKAITREVLNCRGRVYLIKDGLLNKDDFESMYPNYPLLQDVRYKVDPGRHFSSLFSKRLGLDNE